ncbi:MAG: response regulator [Saprospiraceae bacterium]
MICLKEATSRPWKTWNWPERCSNALEAGTILRQQRIDLLFLDIQMPVLTGIDLIKTLQNRPRIILTTAYKEYAFDAFQLDAADYMLKPITLLPASCDHQ